MASPRSIALLLTTALATTAAAAPQEAVAPADEPPVYTHWRTYGLEDGLPSERVLSIAVDGDVVWAGTEAGLARLRDGQWETFTTADGLAHDVVSALTVCEVTGDLWIGTMGGLSRFSAGRIDSFTQLDSGLINDVIYGLDAVRGDVWIATASGVSGYHPDENRWELYNHENTVMHEPWCYGVTATEDRILIAVWAGGVVEHDPERGTWKAYRDPDGEMEIDLVRDDGLVHDVISGVSWENGVLWASTYFGLSRYDGRTWRSWLEHESPLPSNFINFVKVRDGWAWLATDLGLAATDGRRWIVWSLTEESQAPQLAVHRSESESEQITPDGGLPHNFVFSVAPDRDRVWVATACGVALGSRAPIEPDHAGQER
jgi:ligand-binding sensor domain-containing protein